jgi:hypothetical protein
MINPVYPNDMIAACNGQGAIHHITLNNAAVSTLSGSCSNLAWGDFDSNGNLYIGCTGSNYVMKWAYPYSSAGTAMPGERAHATLSIANAALSCACVSPRAVC